MIKQTTANAFGRNAQGKLARDIDKFLTKHELWGDCYIYVNGKRFTREYHWGADYKIKFGKILMEENTDPRDYFEFVGDKFLCMSFEGGMYDVLNLGWEFAGYQKLEQEFDEILQKHGRYYELGNAWNLAVHAI